MKILNTSIPLAPIALKMPISLVLEEIDTEIKLKSISEANTANTPVITENTTFNKSIV